MSTPLPCSCGSADWVKHESNRYTCCRCSSSLWVPVEIAPENQSLLCWFDKSDGEGICLIAVKHTGLGWLWPFVDIKYTYEPTYFMPLPKSPLGDKNG